MRIQLELPEAKVQRLKELMAEAGLETYKDLFNNALSAFEWILDEAKHGRSIASVDESNQTYRVLVMPALQQVASKEQKGKRPVSSVASR
jgi:hypothetical protein